MLITRIMTASVLITIVMLVLFFLPATPFSFLTGVVILAAGWEWTYLALITSLFGRLSYLAVLAVFLCISVFIPAPFILVVSGIFWCLTIPMILLYPRACNWFKTRAFVRALLGIVVLVSAFATIRFIRLQNDGIYALLLLFVLIWGADSAAYFVGRKWGKTKLLPQVSPGKSVQGLLGALLFSAIITYVLLLFFETPEVRWMWIFSLTTTTTLFSVVGDLFESVLKRQAGIKDSGHWLPGHGGILDRIDSLLAAAPIFALVAWLLQTYLY